MPITTMELAQLAIYGVSFREPPKADIAERGQNVRFVPLLLQKSFWLVDQKISRP